MKIEKIIRSIGIALLALFIAVGPVTAHGFDVEEADVLVAADRVCNGGSCLTSNGTRLDCPTSGGPTCEEGEACTCRCIRLPNGTYTAANHCGVLKAATIQYVE